MSQRSAFDLELSRLDNDVLKLGGMCESAIDHALQSLTDHDLALAAQVVQGDDQINQLRSEIEENCYRIIATQQPAARDLRHIIAVVHIATELERIGDHASGIARLVERLGDDTDIGPLLQLPKMGRRVQKMLRKSLEAFIARDAVLADKAIDRDDKVDRQYTRFSDSILEEMEKAKAGIDVLIPTYLLWMAHNLERVGDRVTNICERVIYMVTGKFVEVDY